jgi:TolB-like protein
MLEVHRSETAPHFPQAMAGDIHAALRRICASPAFSAAGRGRQFLTYVVEETLAGRADRIKAYAIATEVFGRDASFDAQNDPIVRVEAGRVRRALDQYYLTCGISDPIRIRIEKGGYVPTIEPNGGFLRPGDTAEPEHAVPNGAVDHGDAKSKLPRVLVEPFQSIGAQEIARTLAVALTEEVISRLASFRSFVVQTSDDVGSVHSALGQSVGALFRLKASTFIDGDLLHLNVRLVDSHTQEVLWGHVYKERIDQTQLTTTIDNLAGQIASALASAYGVIAQTRGAIIRSAPGRGHDAEDDKRSFYTYQSTFNLEDHAKSRQRLLHAAVVQPDDPAVWALLALVYVDEFRFRFPPLPGALPPLEAALQAARRSLLLDAQFTMALHAQMLAFTFSGAIEAALEAGLRATMLCPDDPVLEGEYGRVLAYSGNWKDGHTRMLSAQSKLPMAVPTIELGLAWCSYMNGDYAGAASRVGAVAMSGNPIYHLTAAAIFGQAGWTAQAAASLNWLRLNAPSFAEDAKSIVQLNYRRAEDQARVMDGLRKAGLAIA